MSKAQDRLVEIILDKHNYSAPSLAEAILKEFIYVSELKEIKDQCAKELALAWNGTTWNADITNLIDKWMRGQ